MDGKPDCPDCHGSGHVNDQGPGIGGKEYMPCDCVPREKPLTRGTRVLVKSALLGSFSEEIGEPFIHDGKLCYTMRGRPWIYAAEIVGPA